MLACENEARAGADFEEVFVNGTKKRDSVLECGSPLPLFARPTRTKGARGLAQSTTSRHFARLLGMENPFRF